MKNIIVSVLCIFVLGCSNPDPNVLESMMEKWLKIDVPSGFKILESSYSFAPTGDDVTTVDIEYTENDFDILLSKIKLQEWRPVQYGYQLTLQKDLAHSGYEFFNISIDPERNKKLHIQYGQE